MSIIIKTPQPDTEERLVLVPEGVPPRDGRPAYRDATPADLERGGYVTGERAEKAEWSARVARMAMENERRDREGVRIRKDLGTQDAPCPCDTDPEQGMGMHSPPCPLHEAARALRRKTSWEDAAHTMDGELKAAITRAEKAERGASTLAAALETERGLTEKQRDRAEHAEGLLIQRETELRLAREDGDERARDLRQAYERAVAAAEKAERERDEALGRAQSETEWRVRAVSERQDAEAERDDLRAELARLTAPAKDRATDEELVTIGHAVGKSQAFDGVPEGRGNTWEAWRKECDLAIVRAVAARVRKECLVAQAVARNADFHVTECMGGRWRVVVTDRDVNSKTELCAPAEVPATLARLLGEVSRG